MPKHNLVPGNGIGQVFPTAPTLSVFRCPAYVVNKAASNRNDNFEILVISRSGGGTLYKSTTATSHYHKPLPSTILLHCKSHVDAESVNYGLI